MQSEFFENACIFKVASSYIYILLQCCPLEEVGEVGYKDCTESVQWFIEAQASLRSYDMAPRPSPFSRQQVVSLSHSSYVSPIELTDIRGGGVGKEPNHMTARKLGLL